MSLRDLFLLDPDTIFLNHGSFGATPRPVLERYQEWQQRLEWQPVSFIDSELPHLLESARQELGEYINASAADLVYVPNATFGVNVVARSLDLGPGDEVLQTNHEYGACSRVWEYLSRRRGFNLIRQSLPIPLPTHDELVEILWQGVTERTKVIFMSHITSPTAQHLPVEAVCTRARDSGILTLVDGAHGPGQIPLDMNTIGADFYTGNGHKWLCSPKGSAFLYARADKQHLIEPLVVGWGWGEEKTVTFGSDFLDYLQWLGTNDPAAYLALPVAIQFQAENNWSSERKRCHRLLEEVIEVVDDLTGLASAYRKDGPGFHQMAIAPIPLQENILALKERLFARHRIEVPLIDWEGRHFIRISIQAYNDVDDTGALTQALEKLL